MIGRLNGERERHDKKFFLYQQGKMGMCRFNFVVREKGGRTLKER